MLVIPAINAASYEEAEAQFKKIAPLGAELIHLDVVDGKFAPNVTWGTPTELRSLVKRLKVKGKSFEIHLMVENPEAVIEEWLKTGLVARVIIHVETMTDRGAILEACKKYGVEAMLAAAPETPAEELLPHEDCFKMFQILAVSLGETGAQFKPEMIEKIRGLRVKLPRATIEVDGGMTPEVARQCKAAGADIVVSGWYIRTATDPQKAYDNLVTSG